MTVIKKLWGEERVMHNDAKYCMKELYIESGFQSSLHYHNVKEETFYVVYGKVVLEIVGDPRPHKLFSGSFRTILPGVKHRFWTLTEYSLVIEASTFHSDDDVVRLEPSRPLTP